MHLGARSVVPLVFACLLASAEARQVFDVSDTAFSGSVTVPFPPPELQSGQTSVEFVRNGVSFRLEYVGSNQFVTLGTCDPQYIGGIMVGGDGSGVGFVLTATPSLSALGVVGVPLDGTVSGTFTGSGGAETVGRGYVDGTGVRAGMGFMGAADIGDIGSASFATFGCLTSLSFVPPAGPAPASADLELDILSPAFSLAGNGDLVDFDLDLQNLGPDTATTPTIVAYLPSGSFTSASAGGTYDATSSSVTWTLSDLPVGSSGLATMPTSQITTPSDRRLFSCTSRLTSVATVASTTADPSLANNVVTSTVRFDPSLAVPEVCGNAIDDDCDGRFDCADSDCDCWPSLTPSGGGGAPGCAGGLGQGLVVVGGQVAPSGCQASQNPAPSGACNLGCGTTMAPATCCSPFPSMTRRECLHAAGCPEDPNYKDADPPVNGLGYGYTSAGRVMTYSIHYENIGTGDATDVRIVDVLDEDLDDSTLVPANDGLTVSYDPVTRTIVWEDPLLPPGTPRSVSFEIAVRTDAPIGTRIRNDGVIIFPTALQPRTDTNVVEHVIPDPALDLSPTLDQIRCLATGTPGEYDVELVNAGLGFAYNVTATISGAPSAIGVLSASTGFSHPDDPDASVQASMLPNAYSVGDSAIRLQTMNPGDPCEALTWDISWEDADGNAFDRIITPAANRTCDANGDTKVDLRDVREIMGYRNRAVTSATESLDLDGDGRITLLDGRACVLRCDQTRCAIVP